MKKLFLLLAISPLLVACGQSKQESASTSTTSPKTIVVATAGDIPPFDFEKDGNLTGYDVEVLKNCLGKYLPWSECWPLPSCYQQLELHQRESRQIPLLDTYRKKSFGSCEQTRQGSYLSSSYNW